MSYLTDEEFDAVQSSGLDPWTPFVIQCISDLTLPVGHQWHNGRYYYYLPSTDELVREDVVRWVTVRRKAAQRAGREAIEVQQMERL